MAGGVRYFTVVARRNLIEMPHDVTEIPMSPEQLEALIEQLAVTTRSLKQTQEELRAIYDSPGWRFVSAYRRWLNKGRASLPGRLIDRMARAGINMFIPGVEKPAKVASAEAQGPTMNGQLMFCLDPIYLGKIFYCRNGKRHWVRSRQHIESYDTTVSLRRVATVTHEVMKQYALAGPLPQIWTDDYWRNPDVKTADAFREIAVSKLSGCGIEFGAGTNPMCVPMDCEVKFADLLSDADLKNRAYDAQGADFVDLNYVMGLEDMGAVADESIDFVIASHVIEHVRNPLRAFEQVYSKLKPKGSLVLVVPDMTRTFDRNRELTTIEHLAEDYEAPNAERDRDHYREFLRKKLFVPEENLEARVEEAVTRGDDIHFHTWTYESFQKTVDYARRKVVPFRSIWSHESAADSHEFYFVLQK
jgi:SAM-dependent methyltransferase